MTYARQMLDSYRHDVNVDAGMLAATVDALNDCAQACAADVDVDSTGSCSPPSSSS
jgi:hypothetical protein